VSLTLKGHFEELISLFKQMSHYEPDTIFFCLAKNHRVFRIRILKFPVSSTVAEIAAHTSLYFLLLLLFLKKRLKLHIKPKTSNWSDTGMGLSRANC